MKAVGVKTLKARLSEYIRLVKAGETVLVTERDNVVAEMRPAHRQPVPAGSLDEWLAQMADRGDVTLASDDDPHWLNVGTRKPLPGPSSQEILDELREDRY